MVCTHRASDGWHPRLSDLRGASPAEASGRADHDIRRILRGAPERSLRCRQGPLPRLLLSAKFPRSASGGRQARSYGVVNLVLWEAADLPTPACVLCAGFRTPECKDYPRALAAGVRKAPRHEIAGCWAP